MVEEIKYDIRRGVDVYRAIYFRRITNWIVTGKIKAGETLVWRSGLSGWRRPEELAELTPFFERRERLELKLKRIRKRKAPSRILPQKREIKNILIIDDEKDLCSLLSDSLIGRKYHVTIANTKREGIACVKRESPDLVFLDLKLPDGDGMKILSAIKKVSPWTIVNIISAYGSEESREEARKKGAYSFIDKPFGEKDILKSIKEVS